MVSMIRVGRDTNDCEAMALGKGSWDDTTA